MTNRQINKPIRVITTPQCCGSFSSLGGINSSRPEEAQGELGPTTHGYARSRPVFTGRADGPHEGLVKHCLQQKGKFKNP